MPPPLFSFLRPPPPPFSGDPRSYVDYAIGDLLCMLGQAGRPVQAAAGGKGGAAASAANAAKAMVLCHAPKRAGLQVGALLRSPPRARQGASQAQVGRVHAQRCHHACSKSVFLPDFKN